VDTELSLKHLSVLKRDKKRGGGGGGGGGLTLVILNTFNTKIVNAPNTSGTILPFPS